MPKGPPSEFTQKAFVALSPLGKLALGVLQALIVGGMTFMGAWVWNAEGRLKTVEIHHEKMITTDQLTDVASKFQDHFDEKVDKAHADIETKIEKLTTALNALTREVDKSHTP